MKWANKLLTIGEFIRQLNSINTGPISDLNPFNCCTTVVRLLCESNDACASCIATTNDSSLGATTLLYLLPVQKFEQNLMLRVCDDSGHGTCNFSGYKDMISAILRFANQSLAFSSH